jgi:phasin family protein
MADDNNRPPIFDFGQMFGQFNLPGLDLQGMMEASRQDFEALQQANQTAMQGWQELARKQSELMQQAAQQWQQDLAESVGRSPQENAEKFREGMERGMTNMRELAEIVTRSQNEAAEVLRQRFEENMQRLRGG